VGTRCADHVTPLYPQKWALTSPTGGGRSVGIVRVRTKATEFSFTHKTAFVDPDRRYLLHAIIRGYNTFLLNAFRMRLTLVLPLLYG